MKILLVSHGNYAKALLESVQMIAGKQHNIVAFGLYPQNTVESLIEELKYEIEKTKSYEEILCLTDIFSGSPFNAVVRLMEHYDFYHVSGISLALLLEAVLERNAKKTAEEICDQMVHSSKACVINIRKYLSEKA